MFKITKTQFNKTPHINSVINDDVVLTSSMQYFDKEGYELNQLEQAYYKINTVHTSKILNHICCQQEWILSEIEPKYGAYFDHCMILTRWDYQEAAREQLIKFSAKRPSLNKLLKIKPKYGLDLAMEFQWENGDITEIFHIELDRHDLPDILEWKQRIEKLVLDTDWKDVAKRIEDKKDEWQDMNSDDQSDWRCRFIGLPRAYDNFKVLS